MGDVMLYGVLRMPFDMAMGGEIARRQFYSRAQEAARRLEAAEARLAEIDAALASRPAEVDGSPVDQACARVRRAEAELKAARKALMDVMTTAARTDE